MANYQADAAKVDGVIHGAVEERWLQDARGEDDFVMGRIVESIYGGRSDVPLGFVYRFSDLHELPMSFKLTGAFKVAGKVSANNVELAVVAPFLRKADLIADGFQLNEGFLFGGLSHPGKRA